MEFRKFYPSYILKSFVKYYWIYTSNEPAFNEILYPSGYLELAINISNTNVETRINDRAEKMPGIEVLGQLTLPTRLTAAPKTTLLIVRFYPHAGALFFPNRSSDLTNHSVDLHDLIGNETNELYNRITGCHTIEQQIYMLDLFLIQKVHENVKRRSKWPLMEHLCNQIYNSDRFFNMEKVTVRSGYSPRYIQKLFLDFVGLTPWALFSLHRFNRSLELMRTTNASLTSVAYQCGYYDQAHFIKEFRSYTGITPSMAQ